MKNKTAVEWLKLEIDSIEFQDPAAGQLYVEIQSLIEQAKEMEKEQSHLYAEFAIRCDRKDMKILNFEDWIKLETFKSE
jgi:hypothetical protein